MVLPTSRSSSQQPRRSVKSFTTMRLAALGTSLSKGCWVILAATAATIFGRSWRFGKRCVGATSQGPVLLLVKKTLEKSKRSGFKMGRTWWTKTGSQTSPVGQIFWEPKECRRTPSAPLGQSSGQIRNNHINWVVQNQWNWMVFATWKFISKQPVFATQKKKKLKSIPNPTMFGPTKRIIYWPHPSSWVVKRVQAWDCHRSSLGTEGLHKINLRPQSFGAFGSPIWVRPALRWCFQLPAVQKDHGWPIWKSEEGIIENGGRYHRYFQSFFSATSSVKLAISSDTFMIPLLS